ncbi:MAG: hypothetical protein GOP50_12530 [Candidatus Heimdallarchaeota archaeon]|nr:hypothetical protein [Candidatus Heimdallarchaeota archaeon]
MKNMKSQKFNFFFIENEVRNKTFGILTTTNLDGTPHTSGVLYGVSTHESDFALYIVTGRDYKKTKNISENSAVSFIIPLPHHILRFVPSATVTITGTAEILPIENKELLDIFSKKRILRLITGHLTAEEKKELIFLKIKPDPKILCYGVGINIIKLRSGHTEGGYSVRIPKERR